MGTTEKTAAAPVPLAEQRRRHLPASTAFGWLSAGWRDLWRNPLPSLLYGLAVFLISGDHRVLPPLARKILTPSDRP